MSPSRSVRTSPPPASGRGSQEELGVMASLHRTEVSLLERGLRLPRIDTIIKLAGALEIPIEALIEGIGWSPGWTNLGSFRLPSTSEEGL
jgi:transcriptional regulator with XRE-family HTH domain